MTQSEGDYRDWLAIDYRPAISELLPEALLAHVSPGQTALDVGCNVGGVALFLARHGLHVLGVDMNPEAIRKARQTARDERMGGAVRFRIADILHESPAEIFDVVLAIRLLTCFPRLENWQLLLERFPSCLRNGGLIYIHDFLLAEDSGAYARRYEEGARLGHRYGSFSVHDGHGSPRFIAHHHSPEELRYIVKPYEILLLDHHQSLSMNGNQCRMFEFIGRKQ